jgi:regulator of nucleoside diphosphate kinase
MATPQDLLISTADAESLRLLVENRRYGGSEADALDALSDLLDEARLLPHERLPADRIGMNSRVTYVQEPGGARRTVVLVHPSEADLAAGRISVLSPVGRALLGRTAGAVVEVSGFDRAPFRIRVDSVGS